MQGRAVSNSRLKTMRHHTVGTGMIKNLRANDQECRLRMHEMMRMVEMVCDCIHGYSGSIWKHLETSGNIWKHLEAMRLHTCVSPHSCIELHSPILSSESSGQDPGHWATESADGTVLSLSVRSGPKARLFHPVSTLADLADPISFSFIRMALQFYCAVC